MIVRIQNSIPQVKVTSFTIYIYIYIYIYVYIYNCKFLLQHPKDQSVDQRNNLPGQYIYCPGFFTDNIYIDLVTGQYKKYCPALAFDLPMQSGTYLIN